MTTLIMAVLLIGSLPVLLPQWRHALIAAGVFLAALVVAFMYLLNDLGAYPSGGDGPAFAALIILFGCAKAIVAASLIGRLIAQWLARSLAPPTKSRVIKFLLAFPLVPFVLVGALTALHYAYIGLIGLVTLLFFPFIWLGLALQLAPNNSYMDSPHKQ